MLADRYARVIRALEDASVRYLVAGGVAVNLHGFVRFTKDLDLMIDLSAENARRAMDALQRCGLQARAPVPLSDFCDPQKRADWIQNKNRVVFQVWDSSDPFCSVDVFVRNPLDFEQAWGRAKCFSLGFASCRATALEDLVAMKSAAGRPQDLRDIEELQAIQRYQTGDH